MSGFKRLGLLSALCIAASTSALSGCATTQSSTQSNQNSAQSDPQSRPQTYTQEEIIEATSDFFGVTAEAAASALERVFADNGRPVGYITGSEIAGAAGIGLRMGEGDLHMKGQSGADKIYWQGPSLGFDAGGNASRVFTLVYGARSGDELYQRFPGVEGTAYFVAGLGVNYQAKGPIVLAPIRSGVGLRAGANMGYLSYTESRSWLPF